MLRYDKVSVVTINIIINILRMRIDRFFCYICQGCGVVEAQKKASFLLKKFWSAVSEMEVDRVADTKNADDVTAVTVSAKVMGEVIGVGDRQIRNLAEQGILVRDSHGKYMFLKSLKNYILNLKIAKAGVNIASEMENQDYYLKGEQAKHEHLKSMLTDLKLQLARGQLHKSEDVERVITNMFVSFRSKMEALPYMLAPKLANKDRLEIANILKEHIDAALVELADYNPADYYPADYVDLGEDNMLKEVTKMAEETLDEEK